MFMFWLKCARQLCGAYAIARKVNKTAELPALIDTNIRTNPVSHKISVSNRQQEPQPPVKCSVME